MSGTLLILPTYNEIDNVERLIREVFTEIPSIQILVIDDGSPDGTSIKVETLKLEFSNLELVNRKKKSGLGSAYILGLKWGLQENFSILIEMDVDGSHKVPDLLNLLKNLKISESGLVIGSRWVAGGKIENWPKSREILSRLANLYVQLLLRLGVKDSTSGFRAYTADLLRKIDLESIKSEGYAFQIEMVRAARKAGAKIVEVPITFREREFGKSKISRAIVLEAMLRVAYWGLKRN